MGRCVPTLDPTASALFRRCNKVSFKSDINFARYISFDITIEKSWLLNYPCLYGGGISEDDNDYITKCLKGEGGVE